MSECNIQNPFNLPAFSYRIIINRFFNSGGSKIRERERERKKFGQDRPPSIRWFLFILVIFVHLSHRHHHSDIDNCCRICNDAVLIVRKEKNSTYKLHFCYIHFEWYFSWNATSFLFQFKMHFNFFIRPLERLRLWYARLYLIGVLKFFWHWKCRRYILFILYDPIFPVFFYLPRQVKWIWVKFA